MQCNRAKSAYVGVYLPQKKQHSPFCDVHRSMQRLEGAGATIPFVSLCNVRLCF